MSYRDEYSVSNRNLLSNANESSLKSREEKVLLAEYKEIVKQLEADQKTLCETQNIISQMFSKDKAGSHSMRKSLEVSVEQILGRIEQNDRKLILLESTTVLKDVIEREKKKAYESVNMPMVEKDEPKKKEGHKKSISSIKDMLINTLGVFGMIIYYLIRSIIYILPFVMIGGNFFLTLILIGINTFVPFASAIFWIWGLVCAINGVQDFWAILYYIVFVVVWIPFYISTIISFFNKN